MEQQAEEFAGQRRVASGGDRIVQVGDGQRTLHRQPDELEKVYMIVAGRLRYTMVKRLLEHAGVTVQGVVHHMEYVDTATMEMLVQRNALMHFREEMQAKLPEFRFLDEFQLEEPAPASLRGLSPEEMRELRMERHRVVVTARESVGKARGARAQECLL